MRECLGKGKKVYSNQQESHAQCNRRVWNVWENESNSVWAQASHWAGRATAVNYGEGRHSVDFSPDRNESLQKVRKGAQGGQQFLLLTTFEAPRMCKVAILQRVKLRL